MKGSTPTVDRTIAHVFISNFEALFITVAFTLLINGLPSVGIFLSAANIAATYGNCAALAIAVTANLIASTVCKVDELSASDGEDEKLEAVITPYEPSSSLSSLVNSRNRFLSASSNAYCGCVFAIFTTVLFSFLQAVPFSSQLDPTIVVRTGSSSVARYSSIDYNSSASLDWSQVVLGASWTRSSATSLRYVTESGQTPLTGLIASSFVMAFFLVMLIVSVYMAFSSTPLGAHCPMFLDPIALVVSNTFFVVGFTIAVEKVFAACEPAELWAFPVTLIMILAACSEHIIWWTCHQIFSLMYLEDEFMEAEAFVRVALVLVVGQLPLIGLAFRFSLFLLIECEIVALLSFVMQLVSYFTSIDGFTRYKRENNYQRASTVAPVNKDQSTHVIEPIGNEEVVHKFHNKKDDPPLDAPEDKTEMVGKMGRSIFELSGPIVPYEQNKGRLRYR